MRGFPGKEKETDDADFHLDALSKNMLSNDEVKKNKDGVSELFT